MCVWIYWKTWKTSRSVTGAWRSKHHRILNTQWNTKCHKKKQFMLWIKTLFPLFYHIYRRVDPVSHLYEDDWQHARTSWIHHVHVVVDQSLPTAAAVQVELLCLVVVAVMGGVVRQAILQAGARGGGVTAAERNTIQQETAVHVTPDTTGDRGGRWMVRKQSKRDKEIKGEKRGWRCIYFMRGEAWKIVFSKRLKAELSAQSTRNMNKKWEVPL